MPDEINTRLSNYSDLRSVLYKRMVDYKMCRAWATAYCTKESYPLLMGSQPGEDVQFSPMLMDGEVEDIACVTIGIPKVWFGSPVSTNRIEDGLQVSGRGVLMWIEEHSKWMFEAFASRLRAQGDNDSDAYAISQHLPAMRALLCGVMKMIGRNPDMNINDQQTLSSLERALAIPHIDFFNASHTEFVVLRFTMSTTT